VYSVSSIHFVLTIRYRKKSQSATYSELHSLLRLLTQYINAAQPIVTTIFLRFVLMLSFKFLLDVSTSHLPKYFCTEIFNALVIALTRAT
jgi:hypothetical protein